MKLVGICGAKGAGKDSCTKYYMAQYMNVFGIVDGFEWDELGNFTLRKENRYIPLNIDNKHQMEVALLAMNKVKSIRNYTFAERLKRDVAVNILGLDERWVFGSQQDKETKTRLLWQNMPGVITDKQLQDKLTPYINEIDTILFHDSGKMTVREVLQYLGTDIFRKMYPNVWINCCMRQISTERPDVAIVHDCRFLNEARAIQNHDGVIIKLLRTTEEDQHRSEMEIDKIEADIVVDNRNQTISATIKQVSDIIDNL